MGLMAGKHTGLAGSGRSRVRVPWFSNWAIEYIKHLEMGNSPRLDHRARLTAVTSKQQRYRWRPRVRINAKFVVLSAVPIIAWCWSYALSEQPFGASPKPTTAEVKEICDSIPRLNKKDLAALTWLKFGGVQTASYRQKCSGTTFRLVRSSSDGQLLRVGEASKSN